MFEKHYSSEMARLIEHIAVFSRHPPRGKKSAHFFKSHATTRRIKGFRRPEYDNAYPCHGLTVKRKNVKQILSTAFFVPDRTRYTESICQICLTLLS